MPSMARVRDSSERAEGYPSQHGGQGCRLAGAWLGASSLGGGLVLPVVPRLLAGYSEASRLGWGELIQGKGAEKPRACQDAGRGIPYI